MKWRSRATGGPGSRAVLLAQFAVQIDNLIREAAQYSELGQCAECADYINMLIKVHYELARRCGRDKYAREKRLQWGIALSQLRWQARQEPGP